MAFTTAKISIINTIGSSIGLLLGLFITIKIPDYNNRLCVLPFLGIARVYTFQKAIKTASIEKVKNMVPRRSSA